MRLLATFGVLGLASGLWAAEKMDLAKGREHWAFQPVQRAALPAVKAKDWPQNGIDHFILARLEKAGLQPAPAAAPPHRHELLVGLEEEGAALPGLALLLRAVVVGVRTSRREYPA